MERYKSGRNVLLRLNKDTVVHTLENILISVKTKAESTKKR